MTVDLLLARARRLWVELAGVPRTFPIRGTDVAVPAESLICPSGWIGIVALGGVAISTVPTEGLEAVVREAARRFPRRSADRP
ncbi:hypothetical protein Vqi01_01240 [Micromonospora qiuiae]|uniref:WYL domain-containing protein n=1 Tax=Micromonospora qiuiae TaxID=502268 RepID=A0ABQ4J4C7_9ACTN|nr:hypothetical protein [Micromonospora qiuiae]GIJ24962.1 hypothetical protein Vqi01_01240 [Micromonospora qiuiae]